MNLRYRLDTWLQTFEKSFATHNRIEVSGSAIRHNLKQFGELSGQPVIPVLKGNAYGHGIDLVAKALASTNIPYIAVDGYFEALRIRRVSRQPILILGAILPENFSRLTYDGFTFVVHDAAAIEALGKTDRPVKVHLECNTGMNRYGAAPQDVAELARLIARHKNLQLEGIMSHLADSDGTDPASVEPAVAVFDACVEAVRATGAQPSMLHVAQSAGSLKAKSKYANAIRLGIGLYGVNPFPPGHTLNQQLAPKLQPALKLVSTITQIIELKKGDQVSYNYTFTAPHAITIGVLPLGYYEGVNRALSNAAPIVGRVCMNHTMISLEGIKSAKVGDPVVVYSNNPQESNSIDALAAKHNLFNYNLLTALSPDVRRILVQ